MSRSSIVLRKIGGVFTACRLSAHHRLGLGPSAAGAPSLAGISLALCVMLILPLVALALVVALITPHASLAVASAASLKLPSLLGIAMAGEIETVSNAVVEKRQKFAAKQKELGEVFELAKDGNTYDMSRKTVLEKLGASDSSDAVEKVKARNVELDTLNAELQHAELSEIKSAIGEREDLRNKPVRGTGVTHAAPGDGRTKSFGELYVESKSFSEGWLKHRQMNTPAMIDIDLKTLFQTSAGFAPESPRTGLLVEAATRPIQILDLIPTRPMTQAVDKYMEETTRTHAAVEKAEGTAYPESTFVWTEQTSAVQKIADSIPVTDEQLEDAPQMAGVLDQRLRFGLRQRLDLQVLVGNGTTPNLRGILNKSGIQTQAKSTDPVFDAVYKAMTLVRFTGRALPNALVFHPNDWQDIRLTRTTAGEYIMGNPAQPGPMSLFGLPVALADSLTENTGLVGDFANFCYIGDRRGIEVQIGYVSTQFTDGKKTVRADVRVCFTITRAAAFATITGI